VLGESYCELCNVQNFTVECCGKFTVSDVMYRTVLWSVGGKVTVSYVMYRTVLWSVERKLLWVM
jgi:hypothetical protein